MDCLRFSYKRERYDLLNSEAVLLADKAKQVGVDIQLDSWTRMIHNFAIFARDFPEAQEAIERGCSFLRAHLNSYGAT